MDLDSRYNDSGAGATANAIHVNQHSYAWSTPADSKYVIVEYVVRNDGTTSLQNLFAGLYFDWDLGNAVDNRADYDNGRKMGYVFSLGSSSDYVAIKQLTSGPNNNYALENDGSSGSIGIYNGFTEAEKYITLSTPRATAGQGANGGDVSLTNASGPHSINPGDSITVAFALIAGEDLNSINASADAADIKYTVISSVPVVPGYSSFLGHVYPNPATNDANVNYSLSIRGNVNISLYDVTGRKVKLYVNSNLSAGNYTLKMNSLDFENGVYFLRMEHDGFSNTVSFTIAN
jgi:serine protease